MGSAPANSPSDITPGTQWDGSIVSIAAGMVVRPADGIIRLFKFGDAMRHGQNNPAKRFGTNGISIIEMRFDGFASLQSSTDATNVATTIPLVFAGTQLHVNVRTQLGATLSIEVLHAGYDGNATAAGHGLAQSIPISVDSVNATVRWCNGGLDAYTCVPSNSDELLHRQVRLRLIMKGHVDLFALWFSNRTTLPLKSDDGIHVIEQRALHPCVIAGKAKVSCFGPMNASDSTVMFQSAFDSNASELLIEARNAPWLLRPLFVLGSNMVINFAPGCKLLAKQDEFHGGSDSLLTLHGVSNVTLNGNGAVLQMRRDDYAWPPRGTCPQCRKYTKAEWRMGIQILQSEFVILRHISVLESGGDGVYISGIPGSSNVHIHDCVFDRNYRQGMSVIGAVNLLVERTQFSNTNGTAPSAGVDLEPNHPANQLTNVTFTDCTSFGNRGGGLSGYLAHLNASTVPISITAVNWTSSNGDMWGFAFGALEHGLRGHISVIDSVATDTYNSGVYIFDKADSNLVSFKNCRFNLHAGPSTRIRTHCGRFRSQPENTDTGTMATSSSSIARCGISRIATS